MLVTEHTGSLGAGPEGGWQKPVLGWSMLRREMPLLLPEARPCTSCTGGFPGTGERPSLG